MMCPMEEEINGANVRKRKWPKKTLSKLIFFSVLCLNMIYFAFVDFFFYFKICSNNITCLTLMLQFCKLQGIFYFLYGNLGCCELIKFPPGTTK